MLVVSYTAAAAARVRTALESGLSDRATLDVRIIGFGQRASTGKASIRPDSIPADPAAVARAAAALLVIDRGGLADAPFRTWADCCIRRVSDEQTFGLFVWNEEMLSDPRDPLLGDLHDTVQMPQRLDLGHIATAISTHLRAVPGIREAVVFRSIRNIASRCLGLAAAAAELLAIAFAVVVVVAWLVPSDTLRHALLAGRPVAALACGLVFFPALGSIGFPTSGVLFSIEELSRFLVLQSLAGSLILLPAVAMRSVNGSREWFFLGVVAGVVLEVVRRWMYQADHVSSRPDHNSVCTGPLPPVLQRASLGYPLDRLRCPIVPEIDPRVFISYSRSSPWSTKLAATLRSEFLSSGVDAFLDVESIAVGSVWRQQLNDRLMDANVMIAVVDEITARRPWPAAELEAALRRRSRAGSPDVVLVIQKGLRIGPDFSGLPVFAELLKPHEVFTENEPRVIELTDTTIPVLVATLRRGYYRSPALLPETLETMRRLLTAPFQFLLSRAAAHAVLLGNLTFLLMVIESQAGSPIRRLFSELELLGLCTLASALLAGLTLRFLIAARFEMRPRPGPWSMVWACSGLAGFIALLARWGPMLSPLLRGWATVCLAVGWLWATGFDRRTRLTSDPYE